MIENMSRFGHGKVLKYTFNGHCKVFGCHCMSEISILHCNVARIEDAIASRLQCHSDKIIIIRIPSLYWNNRFPH